MIPVENWPFLLATEALMRAEPEAGILRLFEIAGLDPRTAFRGQDWRFVRFEGQDLRECSFAGSRLYRASFRDAMVAGADFRGSDVIDARGLHLAVDWRRAMLDDEHRWLLELRVLGSPEGHFDPEQVRALAARYSIGERDWAKLVKASKDFVAARRLYFLMEEVNAGFRGSKYVLTSLLDKARERKEVGGALKLIRDRCTDVDSPLVATMISKARDDKEARRLFDFYSGRVEYGEYVYNATISKMPFFEAANDLIEDMRRHGFAPDSVTLNKFIWNARDYGSAKYVYDQIEEPRTVDMNAVLSHAHWHEMSRGPVAELLATGPNPDAITFNVLISRCDTLRDGWSFVDLMRREGFAVDRFAVYNMLALVARGRIDEVFGVLARFAREGVSVDDPDILRKVVLAIGSTATAPVWEVAGDTLAENGVLPALVRLAGAFADPGVAEDFAAAVAGVS